MSSFKNYLSLIKFSHTIFAMPFAMIGFVLGYLYFNSNDLANSEKYKNGLTLLFKFEHTAWDITYLIQVFVLVILCMITARSAAMAFNRYLDRNFDAKNPRTAIREIPAGIISSKKALTFTIVCCVLFMVCCYFINTMVLSLSPVALFVILFYSYTKRFTALCHLVLGLGLSLAPIGAYLAVTAQFHILPVLFSIIVLFWVSGFDIIYALQDEAFDKENKLHSIPSVVGKTKALNVSRMLHFIATIIVISIGIYFNFHLLFWLGAATFIGMLFYQHTIVKPNDLSKVNIAFMTANGIASIVFAAFVIIDLITNN